MILLLVFILTTLIVYFANRRDPFFCDFSSAATAGACVAAILGVVLIIGSFFYYDTNPEVMITESNEYPLIAVKDNTYVYSRYSGNKLSYCYLRDEENKGIVGRSADASYSYLIETDEIEPKLEVRSYDYAHWWARRLFIYPGNSFEYYFYIPKESIKRDVFEIDLE